MEVNTVTWSYQVKEMHTVSTIQYTLLQLVVHGSRGGSTTIQLLHHPWSLLIISVYYHPVYIYIYIHVYRPLLPDQAWKNEEVVRVQIHKSACS